MTPFCDTDRDTLLAALQPVVGIVERRHTLPVLAHVRLRQRGGQVELASSDLERHVTVTADLGTGPGEAATTVPAHKLHDILRALPAGQRLTLSAERDRLTLRSGGSRFALHTLPAADFPAAPEAPAGAISLSLPRSALLALIDRVAFAMAVQDIRYFFNGLLFSLAPGRLTLVGTDGNRLAVAHAEVAHDGPALAVIVPRKTVTELQRLLRSRDDEAVQLQLAVGQVRCRMGALELVSTVIEGQFPDHRRVLPQHPPGQALAVTVDRAAWLAGVQRAVILASEKFRGLKLSFYPGGLRMVAANAELEEAVEELPAEHAGIELEIGLNAAYLIDLLASSEAPQVHLVLRDAQSPLLFTLPAQPDFAYVVGPMRI
ncbi:MAG: DNA polymerase III subunit beta [Rubrivivax sp.]|nr:DNA polymerase III subunit beta [Rubrivivax sp.]